MVIGNKIASQIELVDDAFDLNLTSGYLATVHCGDSRCSISVLDINSNSFIAYKSYDLTSSKGDSQSDITSILNKDELLQAGFQHLNVLVGNSGSTLIPSALFEDQKKDEYLTLLEHLPSNVELASDQLIGTDAINVYAIDKDFRSIINGNFSNAQIIHYSTFIIETALKSFKHDTGVKVIIHVNQNSFDVVVLEARELLFYNSFESKSDDDILYYLLFTLEQLKQNPEKIELLLYGEMEDEDLLKSKISKYIRTVQLGKRSLQHEYSFKFNVLPEHQEYLIFNRL